MITYLRNKGKSLDKFGFEEVYINPQVIERTIKEINTKAMEGGSPQELSLNSVSVKKTLESLGRDNIFPLGELGKSIDSKKRAAAARINSDEHHPKHTLKVPTKSKLKRSVSAVEDLNSSSSGLS